MVIGLGVDTFDVRRVAARLRPRPAYLAICRRPGGRNDIVLECRMRALAGARGVTRTWLSTLVARRAALASIAPESQP